MQAKGTDPHVVGTSDDTVKEDIHKHIPVGTVQNRVSDWEAKLMQEEAGTDDESWLYEEYPDLGLEVLKDA